MRIDLNTLKDNIANLDKVAIKATPIEQCWEKFKEKKAVSTYEDRLHLAVEKV